MITAEGVESPRSASCFAAVRELAGRAEAAGRGVVSPLTLRVRYAIDTPFALGTNGVWRISSDWDQTAVTFQAVLRPERIDGDEDTEIRRLLQGALSSARAHAERTGLASSLDTLDRLVTELTGDPVSSRTERARATRLTGARVTPGQPEAAPTAPGRRAWMSTTLPTTADRVTGWQREFQARRLPTDAQQPPALVSAFQVVAPRLSPASDPLADYACLTVSGSSAVLAALRMPAPMVAGLQAELAAVTSRLAFARDADRLAPAEETVTEALLRPSARRAEEDDPPGPTTRLVRFGVELGVHEDGSPDGRRVGILVLLDDEGTVTRLAATSRQLAILGFDLRISLGLLHRWRLGHHPWDATQTDAL